MRLHNGDHPALRDATRRAQYGRDFHRMMSVIVEHGNAVMLAGAREAALDAGEALEAGANFSLRYAELARHREGGRRIERIVIARHLQSEIIGVMRHAFAPV